MLRLNIYCCYKFNFDTFIHKKIRRVELLSLFVYMVIICLVFDSIPKGKFKFILINSIQNKKKLQQKTRDCNAVYWEKKRVWKKWE
jgi:hypothetical protein